MTVGGFGARIVPVRLVHVDRPDSTVHVIAPTAYGTYSMLNAQQEIVRYQHLGIISQWRWLPSTDKVHNGIISSSTDWADNAVTKKQEEEGMSTGQI